MGQLTTRQHHHHRQPSSSCCCSPSAMEPPPGNSNGHPDAPNGFSYSKFNTALNAGLLNPMSPPLHLDSAHAARTITATNTSTRSSPTLFEMMANEQDGGHYPRPQNQSLPPPHHPRQHHLPPSLTLQERQLLLQERVAEIMAGCGAEGTDVRLTLASRDGLTVTTNVHRQILVTHSRFFASKLSDHWSKQQRSLPHLVEISDCDDVEVYVETLRLMYSPDPRRRLVSEDVPKVLSILKVCAAIAFEDGVLACLEYLEAAPWAEEEEEKVADLLSQLQLESSGLVVGEVLKRVCAEQERERAGASAGPAGEDTLMRLLRVVLEGKDEKARRDMKALISKMLRESHRGSGDLLSRDSLYSAFSGCLEALRSRVAEAARGDLSHVAHIARQADNIHWILDMLIDRQMAEELLLAWAGEAELAAMHARLPAMHRFEMSRVTARLFVGVGKGQVLVPREARWLLLRTWLDPFYEDFGWMRRACRGLDRYSVEDGLAGTALTLPLPLQQEIFLGWFDRFLNSGDECCPNLQKGFEVWWRRAFWRRRSDGGDADRPQQFKLAMTSQQSYG